jgi:hypothetical protein
MNNAAGGGVDVDIITERDGQKLRSHLLDAFRDMRINAGSNRRLRLKISLAISEKPYSLSSNGGFDKVLLSHTALVLLEDENHNIIINNREFTVSLSCDVSSIHGEVSLAAYGRNNEHVTKELCQRIIEALKVAIEAHPSAESESESEFVSEFESGSDVTASSSQPVPV